MDEGGKIAMAIEIRDAVKKKYGRGESEICALDHVNLRIEKGEVCVILGPSGSGKSTLLNMIGGLDRLDAGTVTVEGVELAKQNRKELTEYRRKKCRGCVPVLQSDCRAYRAGRISVLLRTLRNIPLHLQN